MLTRSEFDDLPVNAQVRAICRTGVTFINEGEIVSQCVVVEFMRLRRGAK